MMQTRRERFIVIIFEAGFYDLFCALSKEDLDWGVSARSRMQQGWVRVYDLRWI